MSKKNKKVSDVNEIKLDTNLNHEKTHHFIFLRLMIVLILVALVILVIWKKTDLLGTGEGDDDSLQVVTTAEETTSATEAATETTTATENDTAVERDKTDNPEKDGNEVTEAPTEDKSEAELQENPEETVIFDVPGADSEGAAEWVEYHFRNQKLLDQHYEKHGRDMGFENAEEYESAACKVANDPNALHKNEKEDGDDIFYIEKTNEFVVISTDGYIRTYFYPDAGISYYYKQ